MAQFRLAIGWTVLALVAAATTGCGYTTKQLFPKQYHTVAVPMFENRTFYRHVQADLSEAITKQIADRTPYAIASPASADTILQGTITHISQRQVSRNEIGGMPQEMEVTITVNFQWKNLRTGQTIVSRKGFQAVGHYVPAAPVNQPFQVAQHQAVEQMAHDIVSQLAGKW